MSKADVDKQTWHKRCHGGLLRTLKARGRRWRNCMAIGASSAGWQAVYLSKAWSDACYGINFSCCIMISAHMRPEQYCSWRCGRGWSWCWAPRFSSTEPDFSPKSEEGLGDSITSTFELERNLPLENPSIASENPLLLPETTVFCDAEQWPSLEGCKGKWVSHQVEQSLTSKALDFF